MPGVIGETVKPWDVEEAQNRGIFARDPAAGQSRGHFRPRLIEKSAISGRFSGADTPSLVNRSFTSPERGSSLQAILQGQVRLALIAARL